MVKIYRTLRFGDLEIRDEDVITLPEGMLGFPTCKRFVLLEDQAQAPFHWLQSLDSTDLSFVLVDPQVVKPDYQVQVPEAEVELLQLKSADQARVFVVVAVPQDISQATVNLKGPIVINPNNRMAKQVVLMDERYETKYGFLQALQDQDAGEKKP